MKTYSSLLLAAAGFSVMVATPAMAQNPTDCVTGHAAGTALFSDQVASEHSSLWDIAYHDSYKVLTVADTERGGDAKLTYLLVQCGTETPALEGDLADALVVEVPVRTVGVAHRNALAMMAELGVADRIAGLTNQMFTYAETDAWYGDLFTKITEPQDIGRQEELDFEVVTALEADVVFMPGYDQGQTYVGDQRARGLPLVLVSNRAEPTPLGSAEWLKMVSAFYNAEATANAVFDDIETTYTETAAKVADSVAGQGLQAAYGCIGDEGGCGFIHGHGGASLNGQILDLMGFENAFAANNDLPNGREYTFEEGLAATQDTDFLVLYWIDSGDVAASDPQYQNVPAIADGKYIASVRDNYRFCDATAYIRVDRLVRDYAIGFDPGLFPGEDAVCFRKPN